tara:strand:+ start:1620 stop:1883 length:264 start_codon:yes stop_codon:yes gene_type:complete
MHLNRIGYNKTVVYHNNGAEVFFSYDTPVAVKTPGYDYLKTSTKWSKTTSRHINQWLEGVKAKEVPQEVIDVYACNLPTNITSTEHN